MLASQRLDRDNDVFACAFFTSRVTTTSDTVGNGSVYKNGLEREHKKHWCVWPNISEDRPAALITQDLDLDYRRDINGMTSRRQKA